MLASFLTNDPVLASVFFPKDLPTSSGTFLETCLEVQVQRNGLEIGISDLQAILNEPADISPFEFSCPCLLYGPPNVGKTTLAIRQAWAWQERAGANAHAFVFNSRYDTPAKIREVVDLIGSDAHLLFLVDDIHFAGVNVSDWVAELDYVKRAAGERLLVLWVSRDQGIANELVGEHIEKPQVYEFPLEQVVSLFLVRLDRYPLWQRTIAAFEGQLDPRLAVALKSTPPTTTERVERASVDECAKHFAEKLDSFTRSEVSRCHDDLKEAFEGYRCLLPFGSLGCPVEETFLGTLEQDAILVRERCAEQGLVRRNPKNMIVLTEHPFQIRRQLALMDTVGVRAHAHKVLRDRLTERLGKPVDVSKRTLAEVVFLLYFLYGVSSDHLGQRVKQLVDFAEWSGVREPLSRALGFFRTLLTNEAAFTDLSPIGEKLTLWWLKLARGCYPDDEAEYLSMLATGRAYWEKSREIAEASETGKAGSVRLDTILYELAYIDYLTEKYQPASDTFATSVDKGLAVIDRQIRTADPLTAGDARFALAHIWVAALLERSAEVRFLIRHALAERRSFSVEEQKRASELVKEMAGVWHALSIANSQPAAASGRAYFDALQAVRRDWKPPPNGTPINREAWMEEYFARHERNAWLHALEVSCWPLLYGTMDERIPIDIPLWDYEPSLKPPAPPVGLPRYRTQHVELLVRWAAGHARESVEQEAVGIAALMKAGGGYEYLGDLLILAWRSASLDENRGALEAILTDRIPSIGFNGLAKLKVGG